jgi:hypothetical protein
MKRLLEEILVESTREDVEKEFLYQYGRYKPEFVKLIPAKGMYGRLDGMFVGKLEGKPVLFRYSREADGSVEIEWFTSDESTIKAFLKKHEK